MLEFFAALRNPDISFLRYALLAGLLASVSFGIVGTFVVTRRISYIAGAIAHTVLGGIGAALYLQTVAGIEWLQPMHGAVAAALLAAVVIGLVSRYAEEREDTVIGALWVIGMAAGLLFLAKTPGYVDPMSYLFGNILLVTQQDLWLVAALDVLTVGLSLFFYNKLLAVCFDEEFARLRGVKVEFHYMLLLCLTALTVVMMVTIVGIVLVIALVTLPAAAAGQFARRIWQMMLLAVVFSMLFTSSGLALSYAYDLPSGPVIVMVGGITYLLAIGAGRVVRRPA